MMLATSDYGHPTSTSTPLLLLLFVRTNIEVCKVVYLVVRLARVFTFNHILLLLLATTTTTATVTSTSASYVHSCIVIDVLDMAGLFQEL